MALGKCEYEFQIELSFVGFCSSSIAFDSLQISFLLIWFCQRSAVSSLLSRSNFHITCLYFVKNVSRIFLGVTWLNNLLLAKIKLLKLLPFTGDSYVDSFFFYSCNWFPSHSETHKESPWVLGSSLQLKSPPSIFCPLPWLYCIILIISW